MVKINLMTIEELIFKKSEIKELLPDLRPLFDKWLLSYRIPALNNMRKQAMMDMLNSLDGTHIEKLAKFFKDMVFVEKFDYHTVKNLEANKDCIDDKELAGYSIIALSRKADDIGLTLLR
jgi:hypothetical protein